MRDGWKRVALGEVTRESSIRVGDLEDEAVVLSSTKHHGLVRSDEYFKNRQIHSDDISGYKLVRRGWFAYATNHLTEGSIGLQEIADIACVSPIYTVFSCAPEIDANFMYRVLKSDAMLASYGVHDQASVDRRGAVRYRDFKKIEVNLPPLAEQRRIAEILDEVDTQIERESAIAAKESLASRGHVAILLDQAISAAMNWSSIGDEFAIQAGVTIGPDRAPASAPHGYLRVANVQKGFIESSDIAKLEIRDGDLPRWGLRCDDLLVVEGHASPQEIGRCARVEKNLEGLLYQNHLFRLRALSMIPAFGEIWLNSRHARSYWLKMCSTSSGLHTINSKMLNGMPIPAISEEWQKRIVTTEQVCVQSRERTLGKIEKLESFKRALVDDLLTGKVRVPTPA
ncbi:restriction endonuclease subunit S [Streptomyces sp. NPDC090119]|uniref:restriction endonuclease subunit S n=1 Tax=Streptomyces sp. NPDC090119 TaxID=3365951 RepID=UPI00382747F9